VSVTAANTNVEGRVSVEVELRLPNNKFIPFSEIKVVHVVSSITETVRGVSTHELIVRAPTTDYVDTIIRALQSQGTPMIRYRIGLGLPGQMFYLPWQDQIVTDFSAVLEGVGSGAGHFVRMALKDILFTMSRSTKVASRRGLISSIVQQIATENAITSTVIEPTVGEGLWIQSFVDDEDFVRHRMIQRAINAKGRGCYSFYVQDNVLHFHSPDYQAQLKELVFYQTNNLGLMQLDESQHMLEFGASNVRMVIFDPYTATVGEISSDPNKALRLGNVITPLTSVAGADLNYPFHLSTNTVQEAQNIAQTVYENARIQTLGLKINVARSIFLRVGDLVQVTISPSGSKNSVWSGVYFVASASYRIESGVMVSVFVIQRGEFETNNQTPTSVTILGENLIVNEQQAPGQSLNLKAAESSVLTHGAGKAGYTSIFVDTQSPNTAPNPTPSF
jgi:hypothetical protein